MTDIYYDKYMKYKNKYIALQKVALQKVALQKVALQKVALQKSALQKDALQKGGVNYKTITSQSTSYLDCLKKNNYDSSKLELCSNLSKLNSTISTQQAKIDKEYNTELNKFNQMSKSLDNYQSILGRSLDNDIDESEVDKMLADIQDQSIADVLKKAPSVPKGGPTVPKGGPTVPKGGPTVPKGGPNIIQPTTTIPPICSQCSSCLQNAYKNTDITTRNSSTLQCYNLCDQCSIVKTKMTESASFKNHYINILNLQLDEENKKIKKAQDKINEINKKKLQFN
jgi:hypothetical protein